MALQCLKCENLGCIEKKESTDSYNEKGDY